MGRGESTVGIMSEQVSSGFDCANYGEQADPSVHEGSIETALSDREVIKDFGSIRISWGNSTHVVVPHLALLGDL